MIERSLLIGHQARTSWILVYGSFLMFMIKNLLKSMTHSGKTKNNMNNISNENNIWLLKSYKYNIKIKV